MVTYQKITETWLPSSNLWNLIQSRPIQLTYLLKTPFRNVRMFEALTQVLSPQTLVSIAVEITSENETIRTLSIQEWKKRPLKLDKKPAVFLLYAGRNVK